MLASRHKQVCGVGAFWKQDKLWAQVNHGSTRCVENTTCAWPASSFAPVVAPLLLSLVLVLVTVLLQLMQALSPTCCWR
jgi:hypothetical protein